MPYLPSVPRPLLRLRPLDAVRLALRHIVLLVAVSGLAAAMLAAGAPAAGAGKRYAPEGIGTGGHDPVAYFTEGKAVEGSEQFTAEHAGVTYRFATAEHRDLFKAAPESYLPQYGGYCAYAASQGYLAPTAPEAFTVRGGKLYLNYSQAVRARWLPRAAEHIQAADENWPRLEAE